jgi:hypothetical protein
MKDALILILVGSLWLAGVLLLAAVAWISPPLSEYHPLRFIVALAVFAGLVGTR